MFDLFLLKFAKCGFAVRAVFDVRECPEPFDSHKNSYCEEVNQVTKKVSIKFAPISAKLPCCFAQGTFQLNSQAGPITHFKLGSCASHPFNSLKLFQPT